MKSKVSSSVARLIAKSNRAKYALIAAGTSAAFALVPSASYAQGSGGTTYGLGQGGSPAATDYLNAATGFNASLAPLLTAILPVLVVILAIWKGPWLLKKLVSGFTH